MRKITDRLYQSLEEHMPNFIQHKRQQNRCRESNKKLEQTDDDGVSHDRHKFRRFKKHFEMLESGPRAVAHPLENVKVLESH